MATHLFLDFFYNLRAHRVPVSTQGWLALIEALGKGLHDDGMTGFYETARCLLVGSERHYDGFDQAFAVTFKGAKADVAALTAELEDWLSNPQRLMQLDPALAEALKSMDVDELRRQLLERLAEQKERHDGGSRWVGTGGTSPFGQGVFHPSGVRVGQGGGRSALAVAEQRRYREHRHDLVLDVRQMASALRKLRRLSRKEGELELDLEATIDATAKNAGDIEVIERPPRRNDVRMLLLLDVGGTMDPHAHLVSRLFSAAKRFAGFKALEHYYFHNCVYAHVFRDAQFEKRVAVRDLLQRLDPSWTLVMVGDAWMHPGELTMASGEFWSFGGGSPETNASGLTWLARLADRFPKSAWLNPEAPRFWPSAPTIQAISSVFPMFPLTLEGIDDMVATLQRPPTATRRAMVDAVLQAGARSR
jgi:uncharacterized protein with von Willebrand factor type A (vWA) domain